MLRRDAEELQRQMEQLAKNNQQGNNQSIRLQSVFQLAAALVNPRDF